MTLQRALTHGATKVTGNLTRVFDHAQLESLARQSCVIQRSTSTLEGNECVELLPTAMVENAAVALDGLCDSLHQRNPRATMTPPALHQRLLTPHAGT